MKRIITDENYKSQDSYCLFGWHDLNGILSTATINTRHGFVQVWVTPHADSSTARFVFNGRERTRHWKPALTKIGMLRAASAFAREVAGGQS